VEDEQDENGKSRTYDGETIRHIVTKTADVVRTLLRVGGTVGVFYLIYVTLTAFAGKTSSANLRFVAKVITSLRLDQVISYLAALVGLVYGLYERSLRRGYIEKFSGRIEELESRLDPGRSSSGLPSTGETRPDD
jgi:hypothetical protein